MRMMKKNFSVFELTTEDKNAMLRTLDIIATIDNNFTDSANLTSATTGEVIMIRELTRVRGIISGLVDNEIWSVSF